MWGGAGTAKPSGASPVYGVLLYNHKHNISKKLKLNTSTPVNRRIPSGFGYLRAYSFDGVSFQCRNNTLSFYSLIEIGYN